MDESLKLLFDQLALKVESSLPPRSAGPVVPTQQLVDQARQSLTETMAKQRSKLETRIDLAERATGDMRNELLTRIQSLSEVEPPERLIANNDSDFIV